jgi:hypothetical protein
VQHLKTSKPAPARREEPVSKVEQLASRLGPSNTPLLDRLQAPDDRYESDFAFFRRCPHAKIRNRFPFPGEFAAEDLAEGGLDCFVRAIVERNPGQPIRRARWLLFCQGGTA